MRLALSHGSVSCLAIAKPPIGQSLPGARVVDAMLQVGYVGKNVVEDDGFGEIDVPHRLVVTPQRGLASGWRYETKSTGLRLVVMCPRAAEERERSAKSVVDAGEASPSRNSRSPVLRPV